MTKTRLLPCVLLLLLGCGGGEPADPTPKPSQPASAEPAANEEAATLLDVLHATDYLALRYVGSNGGNSMDNGYWAKPVVWEGRRFTATEQQEIEDRPGKVQHRKITCRGEVSADGTAISELVLDVETLGPAEGRRHHETLTWKGIPVAPLYATPSKNWSKSPFAEYELSIPPDQVAAHVSGWQSTNEWPDAETAVSDQATLCELFLPSEAASFSMSVSFRKE